MRSQLHLSCTPSFRAIVFGLWHQATDRACGLSRDQRCWKCSSERAGGLVAPIEMPDREWVIYAKGLLSRLVHERFR